MKPKPVYTMWLKDSVVQLASDLVSSATSEVEFTVTDDAYKRSEWWRSHAAEVATHSLHLTTV